MGTKSSKATYEPVEMKEDEVIAPPTREEIMAYRQAKLDEIENTISKWSLEAKEVLVRAMKGGNFEIDAEGGIVVNIFGETDAHGRIVSCRFLYDLADRLGYDTLKIQSYVERCVDKMNTMLAKEEQAFRIASGQLGHSMMSFSRSRYHLILKIELPSVENYNGKKMTTECDKG